MDAGRCADKQWWFQCPCTVVFPLEDQSRWSWHYEMISWESLMLLREGTIKGEHNRTLGLSSGCSGTKHLGLLMNHRPSTLVFLVPLMEKSITRMVPGGKWLPFSQVGGIPTSEREPHWWHINRVPNNMNRMQLTQIKWFVLFLARAFAPTMNDCIWSFSSQPLISCPWLSNWVTY